MTSADSSKQVVPILAAFVCLAEGSPAAAPVEIGQWLTVLAFILGIVYICVNIYFKFFPPVSSGEQLVTQEQLNAVVADFKLVKAEVEAVKVAVGSLSTTFGFMSEKLNDIKVANKDLQTYTSTNTHEMKNALNAMGLKMERTVLAVEMMLSQKMPTINSKKEA